MRTVPRSININAPVIQTHANNLTVSTNKADAAKFKPQDLKKITLYFNHLFLQVAESRLKTPFNSMKGVAFLREGV